MPRSQFSAGYRELLRILVNAREEAGMTQAELSKVLGKPQPFVSKVEQGVRRIDVLEFCAIARALGADPVPLFEDLVARLPKKLEI